MITLIFVTIALEINDQEGLRSFLFRIHGSRNSHSTMMNPRLWHEKYVSLLVLSAIWCFTKLQTEENKSTDLQIRVGYRTIEEEGTFREAVDWYFAAAARRQCELLNQSAKQPLDDVE